MLPLLVLLGLRLRAPRWSAWLLIAALMTLAIVARSLLWQRYGREADAAGYYPNIYYATLCRFDEFLPGVAVALLRSFHPALWQRLMARGRTLLLAGVLGSSAMFYALGRWYYIDGHGYSFFLTAFGYTLMALAFALLLCAALSPVSPLRHWRIPGAYPLALASYSIYLSHKPIAHALSQALAPYALPSWLLAVAITASCLAGGALLYWSVERPFLRLRERDARAAPAQASGVASPA